MKALNKILAAILSAVMIAALGSGSAMAAEAQTYPESVVDTEDEMSMLKRVNPHLTEEQWEIVERFNDPDANGLIQVSETQRLEDGQLIIDSYYTDAVSPLVSGRKTYYAFTQIFSDGTTNGELLVSIYMYATFEYNDGKSDRYVKINEKDIDGFALNETGNEYPKEVTSARGRNHGQEAINSEGDMYNYAEFIANINYGNGLVKPYATYITVNERGEQISEELTNRGI